GSRVAYSDLNFILLYYALGEIFGDFLTAARQRVIDRLQLRDTMFNPPASLRPRIAATEWGQRFERGFAARVGVPWVQAREGLMWGEVNDGNSFNAGGTCGNAGLFSTARDVFAIAAAFARGELVAPELVAEATRNQTEGLNERRGLGWLLGGPGLSESSYGHSGFTGTSIWVDGERVFVFMTNRVHPCAAPVAIQHARKKFHELAGSIVQPHSRA